MSKVCSSEPMHIPLSGSCLIEAGAGTGKTYTLAALYVRLVLGPLPLSAPSSVEPDWAGHSPAGAVPVQEFLRDSQAPGPSASSASPDLSDTAGAGQCGREYSRALTPAEILVVTFTEAATQELRDRIRTRLVEVAEYFQSGCDATEFKGGEDEFLRALRTHFPPRWWAACARRLQLAAEGMDEAAISTIHGWCQRMLREHAFASVAPFQQVLLTDLSELYTQAVQDYWRIHLVGLDQNSVAELVRHWKTPAALQAAVIPLLPHEELLGAEVAEPALTIPRLMQARQTRVVELKAPWLQWCRELKEVFAVAWESKVIDGSKLKSNHVARWLQQIESWANDPQDQGCPQLGTGYSRFSLNSRQGLPSVWKLGSPPSHPAWEALAELRAQLEALPGIFEAVLVHATRWVKQRVEWEQKRRAQIGFDDLLTQLRDALNREGGAQLAERIRASFPVAMIDEFQDTDPIQFSIFDAIYLIGTNDPATGLILIGDPKQAIYGFRGADLYTYLAARQACAGRVHTLLQNFRSTAQLVEAVNRCFQLAEARTNSQGAFLFRSEIGDQLPFIPAVAKENQHPLLVQGNQVPALTVWWLPEGENGKRCSVDRYRREMAEVCADEVLSLLELARRGEAWIGSDQGGHCQVRLEDSGALGVSAVRPNQTPFRSPTRRLGAGDLALLVNNRHEAEVLRAALGRRGISSVYRSENSSVFASPEARDLYHWLAACSEPEHPGLVRAALATSLLALSWEELERLNHDERQWEHYVLRFLVYRDLWSEQGVLPLVLRILHDFAVPARVRALDEVSSNGAVGRSSLRSGERKLTNLLHLAELLQQDSRNLEGAQALLRHLVQQLNSLSGSQGPTDSRQLRLESDTDQVQVITVHKAKGLEFPLVFLPFAGMVRDLPRDGPLVFHDGSGNLQVRLRKAPDPDALVQVERERLGEDLRKLYVGLTRARCATWVGLAPLENFERSAFGYLLGVNQLKSGLAVLAGSEPDRNRSELDLPGLLLQLADPLSASAEIPAASVVCCVHASWSAETEVRRICAQEGELEQELVAARTMTRAVRENWWVASYSALGLLDAEAAAPDRVVYEGAASSWAAGDGAAGPEQVLAEGVAPDRMLIDEGGWGAVSGECAANGQAGIGNLHGFFRGPRAGTFLHELLEWSGKQGFGATLADPDTLRDTVARCCVVRGWEAWIDPLCEWLRALLLCNFKLPRDDLRVGTAFNLAGLSQAVPELGFWMAVDQVQAVTLDRWVSSHVLVGRARPPLAPTTLNGMLKGFIDLVFEHEGRYYLIDYKSNWLGSNDQDYVSTALCDEILKHRYDVQSSLYLLALHRLLRVRLPYYDYDRHLGGAIYLFLRGMRASGQGLHFERPPRELIETLDWGFRSGQK